jgi:predicted RNase H-like nuclease (RuvC/YqgF family)
MDKPMTRAEALAHLNALAWCKGLSRAETEALILVHATLAQQLQAQAAEVEKYKVAFEEYDTRTQWVQDTAKPKELGMHRADVLRQRIEAAEAEVERLRDGLAELASNWQQQAEDQAQLYSEWDQGHAGALERTAQEVCCLLNPLLAAGGE